ncbi:MAG: hypothetical protein Kow00122_03070 [Thermoleophilia bacterium]
MASWLYLPACRRLGLGRPGRMARGFFEAAGSSRFSACGWLAPLGAGIAGFAAARAPDAAGVPGVVWLLLFAAGVIVSAAGSALPAYAGRSLTASLLGLAGAGSEGARKDLGVTGAAAVVLAGGLGFVSGLVAFSDLVFLVVLGGALVFVPAVLGRSELLLAALAAFPWIDWLARRSLGALGGVWDELLILGCLAAIAFSALVLRRSRLLTVPVTVPLLLAFAVGLASVVVNDVPREVALFGLRVTFQPLLFFYVGYLLPRDRRWLKVTVAVFLAASLLMAIHGLYQYATGAPMPASWVDAREAGSITTRAYSIVENPNGLGAFLLIGSLLAAGLALASPARRLGLGFAAVSLVLAAGVGVTFSRGAWLGLVFGILVMAALAYRRLLAALVAGGLVAPLLLPAAFLQRLTFAFSSAYISKSLAAGRLFSWKAAVTKAVANPLFGVGLGTFGGSSAALFGYGRLWVDNFYLQLAAEGGIVLLFLFLWLLLRVAKGIVGAYLAVRESWFERGFTAGVFGAFAAVVFANLTAGVWETVVVGSAFWFLSGLAASPLNLEAGGSSRPEERPQC